MVKRPFGSIAARRPVLLTSESRAPRGTPPGSIGRTGCTLPPAPLRKIGVDVRAGMKNDVAVITAAPSPAPTVGCGWTGMGDDTSVAASGEGTNVGSDVIVMMPRSIGGCVAVGVSGVLVGTSVVVGGIRVAVFDGAGVGVNDGSGVLLDVAVGGSVAEGAAVSVKVGVAVALLVGVSVAVGVLVNVALGVVLGKGVSVAVKVAVSVKVGVGDWVSLGSGVGEGRIATAVGLGDGSAKMVGATVGVATTPTGRLQAMAASPRIIKVRYSRRMGYPPDRQPT